jgi:hypothetical protein
MQRPPRWETSACRTDGTPEAIREAHKLWFGTFNESAAQARRRADKAIAICRTCPHLDPCATWAINNPHHIGDQHYSPTKSGIAGTIVGGLTVRQRWEIRRATRP